MSENTTTTKRADSLAAVLEAALLLEEHNLSTPTTFHVYDDRGQVEIAAGFGGYTLDRVRELMGEIQPTLRNLGAGCVTHTFQTILPETGATLTVSVVVIDVDALMAAAS